MPGVHKAVLSQPPSAGQGENNVEKTPHGSRWFNKEKTKLMHMGAKGNQRFFSLFSVSIRCPTACQEARFQHTQCLLWKINFINNECLPFLLFSLKISYLSRHCIFWYNLLIIWGQLSWLCHLTKSYPALSQLVSVGSTDRQSWCCASIAQQ